MDLTLLTLCCNPVVDGARQFRAWKISWNHLLMMGLYSKAAHRSMLVYILIPSFSSTCFLVQLCFLTPEVAVVAFQGLGPTNSQLMFSSVVKLQTRWAVRTG